jgi:cob(I)alamin adenosyltransferase
MRPAARRAFRLPIPFYRRCFNLVHVYTGNGKGKTTAAAGLALRALEAGRTVFFAQFMKNGESGEIKALKRFYGFRAEAFETGFVVGRPAREGERAAVAAGFEMCREAVLSGGYGLAVLDEINPAIALGMVPLPGALSLVAGCPEKTELVFTGRNAAPEIISAADLVTEMAEIKHYYNAGVPARHGVER